MRCAQEELSRLWTAVRERLAMEDGQALIEYALILALVALLTIGVLQAMGTNVKRATSARISAYSISA